MSSESAESNLDENSHDLDEAGHDLTSILQFLIRSRQVRVITSDNNHHFYSDSDDECEPAGCSPPSSTGFGNDYSMIPGEQSPDRSLIDRSDFRIQVMKDSTGWPPVQDKRKLRSHPVSMIHRRELGACNHVGFSSMEKCLIGSRYLPNHKSVIASYGNKVFCGTYSKEGDMFLSSAHDAYVRIYKVVNDNICLMKTVAGRDVGWSILDCVFSPDSRHFVYSSWSECLHVCNVHGEQQIHEALPLTPANRRFCVFSLSFSQDGREIIGGACDENIYIYDIENKQRISRIHSHEDDVNTVAFSDETSQILFSGGDDGLCKVWDRRTLNESLPKPVGILAGHLDGITHIDPKNDGRHLITNSKDQTIKLWDIRIFSSQEGQEATRQAVSRQSWDYRFQRVPKKLMSMKKKASGDTSLMTYSGHTVLQTLIRCRFSPQFTTGQRYIYTGCASGRIIVYDALTGYIVSTLSSHQSCVRDVSWHPYNMDLISSSWDGTIVKWTYAEETYFWEMYSLEDSSDSERGKSSSSSCGLRRSARLRSYGLTSGPAS